VPDIPTEQSSLTDHRLQSIAVLQTTDYRLQSSPYLSMAGLSITEQPQLDQGCTKGRFQGQVAIVTGGAGGIGGMIVQRFLSDGASVAILDMNEERGQQIIVELKTLGLDPKVKFYKVDVSSRAACFAAVTTVVADFGKVHHLVNCVAYFGSQSLEATESDWQKTMSVNVMGTSFMVQAVVDQMKSYSVKENCSVVNMSSISGHQTQPNRWTYGASKGAINILTKNMALDLAKFKIRVNSVSPGWIWSPEVAKAAGSGGRAVWEPVWGKFHISNRLGDMSEVAGAVTFLASLDASFVNATDLKVDGGYGAMSAEGHGESSSFAGTQK